MSVIHSNESINWENYEILKTNYQKDSWNPCWIASTTMGVGGIFSGDGAIVNFSTGSQKDFSKGEKWLNFIFPIQN